MLKRMSATKRKDELINALLELAYEIGPDRLTTSDIAARIGVTQGTVFRHFKNKDELWVAAIRKVTDGLKSAWTENLLLSKEVDAKQRVARLVRCQLELIQNTPALPLILFSRELNTENEELRTIIRETLFVFDSHLTSLIEEALIGRDQSEITVPDIAKYLTSLIQGQAVRWGLSDKSFDLVTSGNQLSLKLIDVLLS
ncbi:MULTISPECIES: TetR/AcrR family transcriptional regulator [unclassified Marinobacterium]|uniref:TetR/AcrR family transcriptional regulator n=2 Tax=unclassified Marinobacterium TaxID=2644139 RepID=UPI0015694759|nr:MULTISPECIES: TetR/AcrR family transcriptional regulator [unclassified Marinobacterium]